MCIFYTICAFHSQEPPENLRKVVGPLYEGMVSLQAENEGIGTPIYVQNVIEFLATYRMVLGDEHFKETVRSHIKSDTELVSNNLMKTPTRQKDNHSGDSRLSERVDSEIVETEENTDCPMSDADRPNSEYPEAHDTSEDEGEGMWDYDEESEAFALELSRQLGSSSRNEDSDKEEASHSSDIGTHENEAKTEREFKDEDAQNQLDGSEKGSSESKSKDSLFPVRVFRTHLRICGIPSILFPLSYPLPLNPLVAMQEWFDSCCEVVTVVHSLYERAPLPSTIVKKTADECSQVLFILCGTA